MKAASWRRCAGSRPCSHVLQVTGQQQGSLKHHLCCEATHRAQKEWFQDFPGNLHYHVQSG